jgi:hypothetical protein
LEFLLNNKDWFAEKKFGRRIQRLLLELNLLGGVAVLDAVPPAEIQTFLQKVGKKLAAEDGAPSASAT